MADRFFNVVVDECIFSFPGILLAIAFVAFLGPGFSNLIVCALIGGWVGYARLVRAQVLAVREKEYVEAAQPRRDRPAISRGTFCPTYSAGNRPVRDWNGRSRLAEATMSFLGLGVPPPTASWESMSTMAARISLMLRTLCSFLLWR